MQEKFTRQAVNALKLARSTVQSCKHTYIGTEHILVGTFKGKGGDCGKNSGRIRCGAGKASGADRESDRSFGSSDHGKSAGVQSKGSEAS